jgi:orotidine-5'-phosphate decarboxylase
MRANPLIVALDTGHQETLRALVQDLAPLVGAFKVGYLPFLRFGWELVEFIHSRGDRVFLDLKFHDIPNTVANAVEEAAQKKVFMVTLHTLGGREMLRAAWERVRDVSPRPLLLGVTLLTHMTPETMTEAGIQGPLPQRVLALATLAQEGHLDGVVASPSEARSIREGLGKGFIIVTPGVRPMGAETQDQKRVTTPREALAAGAHYVVVGRPIYQAPNPIEAAQRILEELKT